ncbi:serine hydrolase domain-containing protein [Actinocatenispora rupis]|uniref:serine hydrolase domain-containing protein n=1 Tax=Actinocatenispora rupis TaxID=519421 RepID=UPI001EF1C389|nr:serine hydrolase domain-containing protein [Actinocatenispora rupis]
MLRQELDRSRNSWPRGVGVIAAAQVGDRVSHAVVGTVNDAGDHPTPDTVFRIASISKVFTALALAVAVKRGEVGLDEPAEIYLPGAFRLPRYDGRPIFVVDLATHTSGLPRDHTGTDSLDGLAATLARTTLASPPGQFHRYSNMGVALLGLLLSHAANTSYETLIADRICRPLQLGDTTLAPTQSQTRRLAQGHDPDGQPAVVPTIHVGAPSGGLYSTATDLLRFLRLHLGQVPHAELAPAAAVALAPRFSTPDAHTLGLCWHHTQLPNHATSIWHNGGLPGFHSYAALVPGADTALVVLANQDTDLESTATTILTRLTD